jgi:CheY-like chemotaxis protein
MQTDSLPRLEPAANAAPERQNILIIDDDDDQVDVLSHRLRSNGFEISSAESGQRGIDMVHDHKPHLVILDLRLPDIDGFSICQQLADDPETCAIPVIIVSGMVRPDIIRRSRSVGCQYYVRKPYDPNALLLLIENALGKKPTL